MSEQSWDLVTNKTFPMYSEDQPAYDDSTGEVGAKKRQLFSATYPAPKSGHASYYCLDDAAFKNNSGDAISIRMSFEDPKRSHTGNVGIFMHLDKAKLDAHQAGTTFTGSPGHDNNGTEGFGRTTGGLFFAKNAEEREGKLYIGCAGQSPSELPASVGSNNDFKIASAGGFQCMRLDYIPYQHAGVDMVKLEIFMGKVGDAWLSDADWRDASKCESSTANVLRSWIFDKNGSGAGGNQHGADANRNIGDPIDGAGACHGFYFGDCKKPSGGLQNNPWNSSDQSAAATVSIGRVETRIVSNTDQI